MKEELTRTELRRIAEEFKSERDAAEKGLIDEVLLHCGAHGAKISKEIFHTKVWEVK